MVEGCLLRPLLVLVVSCEHPFVIFIEWSKAPSKAIKYVEGMIERSKVWSSTVLVKCGAESGLTSSGMNVSQPTHRCRGCVKV